MPDATVMSSKSQTDCENRLYKNIVGAKREFDIAAEARCELACDYPNGDSDNARARHQAFDQEQRALEKYIQALRQYNDFVTDGKAPEGSQE